ncbi:Pkinase-domain-containing protein [Dothidotthia symphoricarpi CBS 119687]|uniref:non-specific serine/threonine protein kinase n=1 Tax=Dothidotthia symphoricarpi CBS 119687 TaxID=1392245 RepID=A0A6A6A485_9PLEO|nr:Pkinase-domain-containing protein [Dothidotthia symphoricarpi CBS 119687]KAF2125401.1 Pkinase-domain-containing protein [Dothidotthia symphoricarpi CBS 119687]
MAENYQVMEELGSGSFGKVYKAIDRSTGETVAIKHIDLEDSSEELADIQAEIALLSTCHSPYITAYKTSFVKGVKLWIVMEYLGGGSAADLLAPGPFSEAQIAITCRELLLGLDYLHSTGKIHRDIKAANVLLTDQGKVKLADFGVAAQLTNMKSIRVTFVGTPFWMAPEVIQEAGYDFRADIWSLGITAMELAEGAPPHAGAHPMKVLFTIPKNPAPRLQGDRWSKDFKDFIAQCLIKDPDRRATAQELLKHRFVQRAGKVELLRELVDRKQMWDTQRETQTVSQPKYYEETMIDLSSRTRDDEWVFDTLKPGTVAPARQSGRRRKLARIPSAEASDVDSGMQSLDLNAAPLGMITESPLAERRRSTSRTSSQATALRDSSGSTPTARRVSNAPKQPLGVDLTFGNSPSTVRHFKRVPSGERRAPLRSSPPPDQANQGNWFNPQAPTFRPSPPNSARALDMNNENQPPTPDYPPMPVTKDALYGRRAYSKVLDSVFQEAYADSGSAPQREALGRVSQAWAQLDEVDPHGEFMLLKAMVDRLKNDPKLASALGLEIAPTKSPLKHNTNTSDTSLSGTTVHGKGTTRIRSSTTSTTSTSKASDDYSSSSPYQTPNSTPMSSPTKTSKLILAQNNPQVKSHRRRQSAFAGGEKLMPPDAHGALDEKKLPGHVEKGMEQQGLLADILYGQWTQGLRTRWPIA